MDICFYSGRILFVVIIKTFLFFFFLEVFLTKTKKNDDNKLLVILFCLLLISITGTTTVTLIKSTTPTISTTLEKANELIFIFCEIKTYKFRSRRSRTNFTLFVVVSSTISLSTLIGRW
jgi:hypothetical protein